MCKKNIKNTLHRVVFILIIGILMQIPLLSLASVKCSFQKPSSPVRKLHPGFIKSAVLRVPNGVSPGVISGTEASGGSGDYSYSWEVREENGEWRDCSKNSLNYNCPVLYITTSFRREVSDGQDTEYTDQITIKVSGSLGTGGNSRRSYHPRKAVKSFERLELLYPQEKGLVITYFDGHGRPSQEVQAYASARGNDIVKPIEYDNAGRQRFVYLPYVKSSVNYGNFTETDKVIAEQRAYYNNSSNDAPEDLAPYSETVYEKSLLNRVLAKGAPGERWQPNPKAGSVLHPGAVVNFEYLLNDKEEVMDFSIDEEGMLFFKKGTQLNGISYYDGGVLFKTVTKDEKWVSGKLHTIEEFKNKRGKLILKRAYVKDTKGIVVPVDTYYVYDFFGNLRYVLPPEASRAVRKQPEILSINLQSYKDVQELDYFLQGNKQIYYSEPGAVILKPGFSFVAGAKESLTIKPASFSGEASSFAEMIYRYSYDSRKRMVQKKIPGAEEVFLVYDSKDRLVATQDGNLRNEHKWKFVKYDQLNRPVITGIVVDTKTQKQLQNFISAHYSGDKLYEERENSTKGKHGYTNKAWPKIVDENYFTITYYDDYLWQNLEGEYPKVKFQNVNDGTTVKGYSTEWLSAVKGQVTGTKIRILKEDNKQQNKALAIAVDPGDFGTVGGASKREWIISATYYDHKYRTIQQAKLIYPLGVEVVASKYSFVDLLETYSRQTYQSAVGTMQHSSEVIKRYTYDRAGRLLAINQDILDDDTNEEVTLAQMEYTELGALKHKKLHSASTNSNFVEQISYKYNIRGWLTAMSDLEGRFCSNMAFDTDGNINKIEWSQAQGVLEKYVYSYDGLKRLRSADYSVDNRAADPEEYKNYQYFNASMQVSGYDLQGNILRLKRRNRELIDDLSYRYIGNQLQSVVDDADCNQGFTDGGNGHSSPEYAYDANGNMVRDDNKGIELIKYNAQNLPVLIRGGGQEIHYIYDAAGNKLARYGSSGFQHYAGNRVYSHNGLDYILHDEGMVRLSSKGGKRVYSYFYNLKDHLGNTRVEFQANPDNSYQISQSQSYYPFGLRFAVAPAGENEYLYNGKELQQDQIAGRSLDWYDFHARYFDPAIVRTTTQDPHAEDYYGESPYSFMSNNPIVNVDPTGMNYDWFQNELTGDVYYHSEMRKGDEGTGAMTGEGWVHMGENGMFSNGMPMTSDISLLASNSSLTSLSTNIYGSISATGYLKGDKAESFMDKQGYDLVPTQQTICESESSSYFPTSPGKGITIISGEVTRITEKIGYIKNDNMEIGKTQIEDVLSKYNVLSISKVSRYEINYTDNAWKKFTTRAVNFSKSMSGTHDYRMKRTYKNWNQYPGNNSLINKFKKEYGTK